MNYYQFSDPPITNAVVTVVLVGVVASELAAPALVVRLLRASGDVAR
jgi:hypothetical protein